MKFKQCGLRFAVRSGAYLCESASYLIGDLDRRAREKFSGCTMRQFQSRKLHKSLTLRNWHTENFAGFFYDARVGITSTAPRAHRSRRDWAGPPRVQACAARWFSPRRVPARAAPESALLFIQPVPKGAIESTAMRQSASSKRVRSIDAMRARTQAWHRATNRCAVNAGANFRLVTATSAREDDKSAPRCKRASLSIAPSAHGAPIVRSTGAPANDVSGRRS